MNGSFSWQFEEYGLPKHQKPIITTGVTAFTATTDLVLDAKEYNDRPLIGLIIGSPGSGKTSAMQYYMRQLEPRAHTLLPACIDIRVPPNVCSKALVEKLYSRLGEEPRRTNSRHEILHDARDVVLANDIKLIFVDEAAQLNAEGFEFLRYLFDTTGCAILFIGTAETLRKIRLHRELAERIGAYLKFPEPTEEEVLNSILPQLSIAHWSFDPANEKDIEMGKQLWASVQPSLRHLCTVLTKASTLMIWQERKQITKQALQAGFLSGLPPLRQDVPLNSLEQEEEQQEEQEGVERTDYEKDSEARHRNRSEKGQGKNADDESS
jgi:Cdc6-like AAA superfamily ATPase